MGEPIEHIPSPDGRTRVTIHRRTDGRYAYSLDRLHEDDVPEYAHRMTYWSSFPGSGLYDSAATARREAAAEYPWVGDSEAG
jgi:hypothetical protein